MRRGKFGMRGLDGGHGGTKIKAVIRAIGKHKIFSAGARPHLAGDKVTLLAAAKSAVPGLDHKFELLRHLPIEAHPLALDDSAIERRRSLLILPVESPAPHADALAIEKRLRQPLRPKWFTGL